MTKKPRVALCDSESAKDTRGVVLCAIDLADGKAPDSLMLFPASDVDGEIKCRDGRRFRLTNPEKFAAAFNDDGFKVPFDFDHRVEMGGSAAVGWIKTLEARAGAIWANVKWLKAGRDAIESEEYAFVSPAFNVDWEVGEIKGLTSAALTNRPAMKLPALTSAQPGDPMEPEVLKLLGLDDKATAEEIAEAAKKLQEKNAAEAAAKVELEAANVKLKAELAASQPSLAAYVPRADFDAAVARTAALEKASADEKASAHSKEVAAEIASAKAAGKFAPASEAFYVKTCSTPEGLAAFREFVKTAPVIAADNIVDPAKTVVASASSVSDEQLAIAERCGVTKEQFAAALKANS